MLARCLAGLWLAATSLPLLAQVPIPVDLKELHYMAGHWQTNKWGGPMEEIWSTTGGESLIGTFAHWKEGKPSIYEFFVVERAGESVVLLMRHFHAGNVAFEEKDKPLRFTATKKTENSITFAMARGASLTTLRYERVDDETLEVRLRKVTDGKGAEEVFRYTRVKPEAVRPRNF